MKNFLVRDALIPALAATTKEGAIRELVGASRRRGTFARPRSSRSSPRCSAGRD